MTRTRLLAGVAIFTIVGVLLASASGCYRRVVRADGPGADDYEVSEPYQEDTKLDEWFYGKDELGRKRSGSRLKD